MNPIDSSHKTFWQHADELRKTLIKSIIVIFLGVIVSCFFYREIFQFLQSPILAKQNTSPFTQKKIIREQIINESQKVQLFSLPENAFMVTGSEDLVKTHQRTWQIPPKGYLILEKPERSETSGLLILGPIDGILIAFKVCFYIGVAITSPIVLYFIFNFIAPAFEPKFYRLVLPFLGCSILFMFFGACFAFFLTIPIANQYLLLFNQDIGINFWTLTNYLDYTLLLVIGNALSFEMLTIAFFLVQQRILTSYQLERGRRYFIVASFIIAALLTPPDVLTQVMLAVPLIILYECLILYSRTKNYLERT